MHSSTLFIKAIIAIMASFSLVSATPVAQQIQAVGVTKTSNSQSSAAPPVTVQKLFAIFFYNDANFAVAKQEIWSNSGECATLGPTADNQVNSFKIQPGWYCEFYDQPRCPTIDLKKENVIRDGWIWKTGDETDVNKGTGTWADKIASYRCFKKPDSVAKMTTADVKITPN